MKLKDARRLRDFLRGKGIRATVPLGYAPDGYGVVIVSRDEGRLRFDSPDDWNAYARRKNERERRLLDEWCERHNLRPARSPIEIMIDRACGLG